MTIFDRIQFLLSQKGWKEAELVRSLGPLRIEYDEWKLRGKIPGEHYAAVAQVLDTTIAFLRGETDTPEIPLPQGMPPVQEEGTSKDPSAASAQHVPQIQKIYQSLHGLDAKSLRLIEGFIDLYKSQQD